MDALEILQMSHNIFAVKPSHGAGTFVLLVRGSSIFFGI
jgi:hypothetical protein